VHTYTGALGAMLVSGITKLQLCVEEVTTGIRLATKLTNVDPSMLLAEDAVAFVC